MRNCWRIWPCSQVGLLLSSSVESQKHPVYVHREERRMTLQLCKERFASCLPSATNTRRRQIAKAWDLNWCPTATDGNWSEEMRRVMSFLKSETGRVALVLGYYTRLLRRLMPFFKKSKTDQVFSGTEDTIPIHYCSTYIALDWAYYTRAHKANDSATVKEKSNIILLKWRKLEAEGTEGVGYYGCARLRVYPCNTRAQLQVEQLVYSSVHTYMYITIALWCPRRQRTQLSFLLFFPAASFNHSVVRPVTLVWKWIPHA